MSSSSKFCAGNSDSGAENSNKRMKLSDESNSVPKLSCAQMIKRFTLDPELESDQSLHEFFVNGTTLKTAKFPEKENVAECQGEEVKLPATVPVRESRTLTDFTRVEEVESVLLFVSKLLFFQLLKHKKPARYSEKAKYEYALFTYCNVIRSCYAAQRDFPDSPDRGDELRRSVLKRNLVGVEISLILIDCFFFQARRESSKYRSELLRKTPKRKAMSLPFFFKTRELFPQSTEK